MPSVILQGHCDARFEGVRSAFADNFEERGDIGASVAVVVEGHLVVDLWGGHTDADRTSSWQQDTLVNVWSVGKAVTALTLLKALESHHIDVDEPVSTYWPEFAAEGKDRVSFATAMSHRAGLCTVETPLPENAYLEWDLMADAIARQKPWWQPGTGHGYHTNTIGFLLGEPVRRITGKPLQTYFQEQIAAPLELDFHFGVPVDELYRCADLVSMSVPAGYKPRSQPPDENEAMNRMRSFLGNPGLATLDFNSEAWRTSVFPSTSPQSNARSIARLFGKLADLAGNGTGGIISPSLMQRAIQIASDGEDLNVRRPTRFGLGFQLTQPHRPLGPNKETFGHYGNGGHLGFADPAASMGFAYSMNHQGFAWRDPRNIALTDAVYASL
jgi:CubicO group peptidase (beta-lactamase class C family)|tara:strand:+ start:2455 stop:3609 length:1155 start_codon:yes stop_codon:yes gene_type:complete